MSNFSVLYVDSPARSVEFYTPLLGKPPVEQSEGFAMYVLEGGSMIGLWARQNVEPKPLAPAGGAEVAFALNSDAAVDQAHADWLARGLPVAQAPTRMDFGYSATTRDPDGHPLRFFCPAAR
jgi:catechol 2,3-dioxygenase-like lactoylglutathione lyase family enzyme